jgi:hypothetical protein
VDTLVGYCKDCDCHREFISLKTHVVLAEESLPIEYTFSYCAKCEMPAIFIREDYGVGFAVDDYYLYFPLINDDRILKFDLPDLVEESYEHAVKCEVAKLWVPTVVMVGRALEAVCRDIIPDVDSIFEGLKEMHSKGLISEELLDWANELRYLRNVGAHAIEEQVIEQDAKEALDFLQAILEIIYHLRPKFKAMKERRVNP